MKVGTYERIFVNRGIIKLEHSEFDFETKKPIRGFIVPIGFYGRELWRR